MRKGAGILAFCVLLAAVALPLSAQQKDPPRMLTFLSYTATLSIFTDTVLSYEALWNHKCYESNLFWVPLMKYPPLVMTLDMAIGAGVTLLARRLWRTDNKALAWAVVIAVNVVQGYCLWYQWQLRRDGRWEK
jgi:ABC-type multidrug transport system permease subunit